jgi:hypothetical protein
MPSWYVLVLLSSGIVMNEMYGVAERSIGASVACVYWYIADYQAPHPRFLPSGTVLTESDLDGDAGTTQVVTPDGDHGGVRIETSWHGRDGVIGWSERRRAPRVLARVYADELVGLDRYAQEQESA